MGNAIHTGTGLLFCLASENSYCHTAVRAALWKIAFPLSISALFTFPSTPINTRTKMVPCILDFQTTSGYRGATCSVIAGLSSTAQY